MPTPGGLLKAGDRIVNDQDVYVVVERTSNSAPYSVWIKRADDKPIGSFRNDNMRNQGKEARLMLETGHLTGNWKLLGASNYDDTRPKVIVDDLSGKQKEILDRIVSEAKPAPRRPLRNIRVRDAHRWRDEESALEYGEQVEVSISYNASQGTTLVMSDAELMDMCIRGLTYLRDKAEGITP